MGEKLNPEAGIPNTVIVNVDVSVLLQVDVSMAISLTKYVPVLLNKCVGLTSVDVVPSPKSHIKSVPPNDVLLKTAEYGTHPLEGVSNLDLTFTAKRTVFFILSGELQNTESSTTSFTI